MIENKYSYLPNSYTIKFFKPSKENQQKSFKPLLIINNLNSKNYNNVAIKKQTKKIEIPKKNKSNLTENQIYNRKNNSLIQKRKKAINQYLNNKKKSSIKTKEDKKKIFISKINENNSSSSISKKIPHSKMRINYSFQELKNKKKSNIISQIKNSENNNKKLNESKIEKEINNKIKDENINNEMKEKNKGNNLENKIIIKNSNLIINNSNNNSIKKEERNKTSEKSKNETNKIFMKELSVKNNCFLTENRKDNNIKIFKLSLVEKTNSNGDRDKQEKEIKSFQPNMNIFKNINNFKFLTEKNSSKSADKIKKIKKENRKYIKEKINIDFKDEVKKRNNSMNNNGYETKSNDKSNQAVNNNKNFKNYITYNGPKILEESIKNPINSELSQFTFKNEGLLINNNQHNSLIAEKRRNELNKLINFSNKF